jgi:hypothetical protein
VESVRAFDIYVDRGVGAGPHTQPAAYYLRLLSYSSSGGLRWSEGLIVALLAAVFHLAVQDWRANFRYPADPRNPYVYAHTVPDLLRLTARVTDVAAFHPDGAGMLVKVIAGPYEQWPIPWYLRRLTRVGYWVTVAEAGRVDDAPVVIAAQDQAVAVAGVLGDRYIEEHYGLRPDVVLTLFIERASWDRFIAARSRQD